MLTGGEKLSATEGKNMCIIGKIYGLSIWCDIHKYGVILEKKRGGMVPMTPKA